ncbi:MAG: HD domain-containing protein, partial [Methylococcales bacterium]|nr:HD domain-containing protein [Methylococcales bacterium]
SEEVIVAALLHDVGHFVSEFGTFTMNDTQDRYHEEAGAQALLPFFPSLVVDCVRYHVLAKRYLCATRPEYFERLSEASVHSLKLQGGPMTLDEVAVFEESDNLREIIKVRYFDDEGKQASMKTEPFSYYMPMVQRVVDRHCTPEVS